MVLTVAHTTGQHQLNGGSQCDYLAISGSASLSEFEAVCAQQDQADDMVDLAKQMNSTDLIQLAQFYAQQPHSSVCRFRHAPTRWTRLTSHAISPTAFHFHSARRLPGTRSLSDISTANLPGSTSLNHRADLPVAMGAPSL